ncbi:hypothetical protein FGG08_003448 [Glutinoglossum americanum]|uniref:Probable 26S proteasome regulatory subunit p27 n=1 Tax=Glutinoglossum americanum TaxID=1670608 RepID=A0A9P8I770_9PEZI|nr:hypothetical protein FGG08_003448 [Glutinoglossum americanum]
MGLPMAMENATVALGPSSWRGADGTDYGALPIMQIIEKKQGVEAELKELSRVLESHNVDMSTPLTTPDGFPRADLDVTQIRTTRSRIIHIRNDYKVIMQLLEAKLHEVHARAQSTITSRELVHESSPTVPNATPTEPILPAIETPFAKVSNVVAGSPAEKAGLRQDDQIRKFGNVTWLNHENLSRVKHVVQSSEGRTVIVKLVREGTPHEELELELNPRHGWGGSGMLGCTLVPL